MSKVTSMLDAAAAVITDIRALADSLQALVDAMAVSESVEKPAVKKKAEPKKIAAKEPAVEPASPTLEDVRAVLAEKSRKGYTAEVKALLTKHGADKLLEIDPENYAALLADAEEL